MKSPEEQLREYVKTYSLDEVSERLGTYRLAVFITLFDDQHDLRSNRSRGTWMEFCTANAGLGYTKIYGRYFDSNGLPANLPEEEAHLIYSNDYKKLLAHARLLTDTFELREVFLKEDNNLYLVQGPRINLICQMTQGLDSFYTALRRGARTDLKFKFESVRRGMSLMSRWGLLKRYGLSEFP